VLRAKSHLPVIPSVSRGTWAGGWPHAQAPGVAPPTHPGPSTHARDDSRTIAERSITLVRDTNNLLPLRTNRIKPIIVNPHGDPLDDALRELGDVDGDDVLLLLLAIRPKSGAGTLSVPEDIQRLAQQHAHRTIAIAFGSPYILRELGVMPSATLAQAQEALDQGSVAFVPTAVLAPGLTDLLSLRGRLGVRSSAHSLAKLMDPFETESLRIVSVSHPPYLELMREFLLATSAHALLLRSTEGEAFANPKRRPRIEYFKDAAGQILFEAEAGPLKSIPTLPAAIDAVTTAAWIKSTLIGEAPVPLPIVNQLACCLYASGYTSDMNQAKAIVAVETGSLAAA